jgi:hypothetical protein
MYILYICYERFICYVICSNNYMNRDTENSDVTEEITVIIIVALGKVGM